MRILISAERVYALAFTSEEAYNASVILQSDIVEVESRYLMPIVGLDMYNAMRIGEYEELVDEYVAPMVAAWVRYVVEPHLASRCCLYHDEQRVTEAINESAQRVLRALRDKAVSLTRRLVDQLNTNREIYVEYNPEANPLNRCFIYGNVVQIS